MSNHYDLSITPDGKAYQFTTSKGDYYIAYFTEFTLQNSRNEEMVIPCFGFEKRSSTTSKRERYDARVKATILYIVREFFQRNPDKGVLYLCMNSDEKARNRHITFNKWFLELGTDYEKHDSPSSYQAVGLYSSIVVSSMSDQKSAIIEAFFYTIDYWMNQ